MKIILAMVMSLDGKTTKNDQSRIFEWTSKEDQKYFTFSLIKKYKLIIMGRKTFESTQVLPFPSKSLRVVLTTNPYGYKEKEVAGQVEFANDSPEVLVQRLEQQGFKEALLIGGQPINTEFLKLKLINEIWVTIEPVIFGSGNNLVFPEQFNIELGLYSLKKLNNRGTLLLKYKVH